MNILENYRPMVIAVAIMILLSLSGCMQRYGSLKTNPDLTEAFKDQLDLPDYNYYYCGRASRPYAVVGIDRQYEFQGKTWHKIETKDDVYKKAAAILTWNRDWSKGSDVLDPAGKKIGIWFSYYRSTGVEVGPENRVSVYNPYRTSDDLRDTQNSPGP